VMHGKRSLPGPSTEGDREKDEIKFVTSKGPGSNL
jgi:hypothetical protein